MTITYLAALAANTAGHTSTSEAVVFWVLAVVAVVGAIGVVAAQKAVYSAMSLASTMIALAVLYIAQDALFLGVVQVVVYTGAVMMLFLFVLMLVGINSADSRVENIKGQSFWTVLGAVGFLLLLLFGIGHAAIGPAAAQTDTLNGSGNLPGLAQLIFTTYVFPFEVTSALLITSALGAMVLAHRERTSPKPSQRELAARRLERGHMAPEPSPGVYALHDAADRPALLPDGTTSPESVSTALAQRSVDLEGPPVVGGLQAIEAAQAGVLNKEVEQ